jgi:hypothetical protein
MRSLVLIAISALAFASVVQANVPAGPYTLNQLGLCVAANGKIVSKSHCGPPAPQGPFHWTSNGVCHAANGKPVNPHYCRGQAQPPPRPTH